MTKALVLVLAISTLFALGFAAGGAGIYGSPFTGKGSDKEALYLWTILVAPVTCLAALLVCRLSRHLESIVLSRISRYLASIVLLGGAIVGAYFGSRPTAFRAFWVWPFLIFVWAPMAVVAVGLSFPSSAPSEPADPSASKATTSLCLGVFALIALCIPWISVPTAIAGIVMGMRGQPRRNWAAKTGIGLSILSLLILFPFIAFIVYRGPSR
jgi:hypothetical protein